MISLVMLFNFLPCLPQPFVGGSAAYGRQMIRDALVAVDAWFPRDQWETMLAMQIPVLTAEVDATYALAQCETDWDRMPRGVWWPVARKRNIVVK